LTGRVSKGRNSLEKWGQSYVVWLYWDQRKGEGEGREVAVAGILSVLFLAVLEHSGCPINKC
jgi:hypothetical protein